MSKTLPQQVYELVRAIDELPASKQATDLVIQAGEILTRVCPSGDLTKEYVSEDNSTFGSKGESVAPGGHSSAQGAPGRKEIA